MFTLAFWKASAERAAKTAGQFVVLGLGTVAWTDVEQVLPAAQVIGLGALFGAVLSLASSLASFPVGLEGPSLANETIEP